MVNMMPCGVYLNFNSLGIFLRTVWWWSLSLLSHFPIHNLIVKLNVKQTRWHKQVQEEK
jgi:hypothetical protein